LRSSELTKALKVAISGRSSSSIN